MKLLSFGSENDSQRPMLVSSAQLSQSFRQSHPLKEDICGETLHN